VSHARRGEGHQVPGGPLRRRSQCDGEPEGEGVLEYPGNDEFERMFYEGGFKAKKAHGKGLMKWRRGPRVENMRVITRERRETWAWKYTYPQRRRVEVIGGIKQVRNYTYGSGDVFEGVYNDNERHGDGFLSKVDGEKRNEIWKLESSSLSR
ncbi:hypothetical protein TCAL_15859, partial [Tigriopus californicus]